MDTLTKLGILADAAKYDAACTSSGVDRAPQAGKVGFAQGGGLCHSFTPDGRCVTLLKVLMSNACSYDCAYCVNRRQAGCKRATFEPRELAELTVDFLDALGIVRLQPDEVVLRPHLMAHAVEL